jgi:hypothetical protein
MGEKAIQLATDAGNAGSPKLTPTPGHYRAGKPGTSRRKELGAIPWDGLARLRSAPEAAGG